MYRHKTDIERERERAGGEKSRRYSHTDLSTVYLSLSLSLSLSHSIALVYSLHDGMVGLQLEGRGDYATHGTATRGSFTVSLKP